MVDFLRDKPKCGIDVDFAGLIATGAPVTASLDPGLRKCGAALFIGDYLVAADTVETLAPDRSEGLTAWRGMARAYWDWIDLWPTRFVCETMQVYSQDGAKCAANLLDLQGVAGTILGVLETKAPGGLDEIRRYLPRRWTKSRAPERTHKIILRALRDGEKRRADFDSINKTDREHAIEATGIGLYHARRI